MTPSVQIADGRRVTRWNRESIIEKIAEWHDRHGEPPVSADWNPSLARWRAQEWRAERYYDGAWPSTNAVKRAFGGSFDAAVRAAGFEPARPGPRRRAHEARPAVEPRPRPEAVASRAGVAAESRAGEASAAPRDGEAALVAALARADALEARLASAERRAERAEERLRESRRRAKLATDRATRARRTRDRVLDEADARVRAALDQADAAVRDAEALRRGQRPGATGAGPAGPAPLAAALRRLASARASGDRHGLRRELGEVAASALRWRDRL